MNRRDLIKSALILALFSSIPATAEKLIPLSEGLKKSPRSALDKVNSQRLAQRISEDIQAYCDEVFQDVSLTESQKNQIVLEDVALIMEHYKSKAGVVTNYEVSQKDDTGIDVEYIDSLGIPVHLKYTRILTRRNLK